MSAKLPVIPISQTSHRISGHRLTQKEERVALREWRQEMSNRLIAMEEALKSEAPNFQATEERVGTLEERMNSAEEALLDLADLVSVTDAPMDDTNTKPSGPPSPSPQPQTQPRSQPRTQSETQHDPPMTTIGQQSRPPPPPPTIWPTLNIGPPAKTRADNVAARGRGPRRTRAHQLW